MNVYYADFIEKKNEKKETPKLPILSLQDALSVKLKPLDYVLPGLPLGKVGLLSAAGGVGKSIWVLQASLQVAVAGFCDFDLSGAEFEINDPRIGSVLIVSLEDDADDISRRYQMIKRHWVNDSTRSDWINDVADNQLIELVPLAGSGVTLITQEGEASPYLHAVEEKAKSMHYCRLIVIDTLRRSHDCDENDNGVMSKVLRQFEVLAQETGAAILIIHHEAKAAIQNASAGAAAMRGASAIVDNARWVMRMQRMTIFDAEQRGITDDEIRRRWVRVTNEKCNYGKEQAEKWLRRGDDGVLKRFTPPAVVEQTKAKPKRSHKL